MSRAWNPPKSKPFDAEDVYRALRVKPRTLQELRDAIGTVQPSPDNWWLSKYLANLRMQGRAIFIGVTNGGRWHALPLLRAAPTPVSRHMGCAVPPLVPPPRKSACW